MLVIRTDFSDEGRWKAVRTAIDEPGEIGYMYPPEFWERRTYEDASVEGVLARLPEAIEDPFVAVVDRTTISSVEMPILLVDLRESDGRTFRVIPSELPSIEVNLSLANMDFFEFADSADGDGVFRGFSGQR
ncbi:DUF6924 domain-containing protein [Actinomadura rugatobispora]|uniref:DUF6924 domain-containing protein n=1 Tax=Actinomadura rugatobispora TaxID=1994 RepID=A0ABW1ACX7_9ACTN|nr:hypothetical protein GCM10010200_026920 [Actinomadura rugatobispora]